MISEGSLIKFNPSDNHELYSKTPLMNQDLSISVASTPQGVTPNIRSKSNTTGLEPIIRSKSNTADPNIRSKSNTGGVDKNSSDSLDGGVESNSSPNF